MQDVRAGGLVYFILFPSEQKDHANRHHSQPSSKEIYLVLRRREIPPAQPKSPRGPICRYSDTPLQFRQIGLFCYEQSSALIHRYAKAPLRRQKIINPDERRCWSRNYRGGRIVYWLALCVWGLRGRASPNRCMA